MIRPTSVWTLFLALGLAVALAISPARAEPPRLVEGTVESSFVIRPTISSNRRSCSPCTGASIASR